LTTPQEKAIKEELPGHPNAIRLSFQETENDLRAHANSSPRAEVELQALSKPLGCSFKTNLNPINGLGNALQTKIRLTFLM
jgi:hypothetical protein